MELPEKLKPGMYGVSHGSGMAGELIRHATSSWAGHAFIYIGNGQIVEGQSPATHYTSVTAHPDAIWNLDEPGFTDEKGALIVARAHALVGIPYDWPAYVGFALETLKIRDGKQLAPFFRHDKYRVCSADVADAYTFANIDVTSGLKYPNLVSPADLLMRIVRQSQISIPT
jgi:uncharacterized protein YycO